MKKEKLKAFVIEPSDINPDAEKWSIVNMTELMDDGTWMYGANYITSIEGAVERADKENVPIITRRYLNTKSR
jgi:hypothetical protein